MHKKRSFKSFIASQIVEGGGFVELAATVYRGSKGACLESKLPSEGHAVDRYKADYIGTNLEALQETIQKKQDNMNLLVNIMQSKLQAEASK